jgi:hypothetical protein
LQAFDEFGGDGRDAFLGPGRKRGSRLGVRISENDPQAWAVALITAGANGAGQLREFERERGRVSEIEIGVLRGARLVRRVGEKIHEDAAGVINEVTETLRDEDSVHIAGRGLLELDKVVIGKWILERNFDCRRGPIGVGRDMDGHNIYSFTPRELFRIGAAGENGEGAVELLSEHDAGEFVRKGHGAERKFLMGALAEVIREAVGIAAEEDEFAGTAVAKFAEPLGEGVRIEIFPGSVEKENRSGAIGVEFLDGGGPIANFGDFDGARAADSLHIVVEDGAHFWMTGFS